MTLFMAKHESVARSVATMRGVTKVRDIVRPFFIAADTKSSDIVSGTMDAGRIGVQRANVGPIRNVP
ncbi:MAG: hypothetical protein ABIT38_04905 [Gemmatimonadaceae bacterium]